MNYKMIRYLIAFMILSVLNNTYAQEPVLPDGWLLLQGKNIKVYGDDLYQLENQIINDPDHLFSEKKLETPSTLISESSIRTYTADAYPVFKDHDANTWLLAREGRVFVKKGYSKSSDMTWTRGAWRFQTSPAKLTGMTRAHAVVSFNQGIWLTDERGVHHLKDGQWHYHYLIKRVIKGHENRLLSVWDAQNKIYYVLDAGAKRVFDPKADVITVIEDGEGFQVEDTSEVIYLSPRLFMFKEQGYREISLPEQWTGDEDPGSFSPITDMVLFNKDLLLLREDGRLLTMKQRQKPDASLLAAQLTQLGASELSDRNQAMDTIIAMGVSALDSLDDALTHNKDPEVEWRLNLARDMIRGAEVKPTILGDLQIDYATRIFIDSTGQLLLLGVIANGTKYDIIRARPLDETGHIQVSSFDGLNLDYATLERGIAGHGNDIWISARLLKGAGIPVQNVSGQVRKIDLTTGEYVGFGPNTNYTEVVGITKSGAVILRGNRKNGPSFVIGPLK